MSRHLADLEQVLGKILSEHRRLLTQLDAQQAAMKTMNVIGMNDAATAQESTRLRLLALETQRKLLALALGRELRITGEVTLVELARQVPARATELLRLREQLREVIEEIRQRTHIGARLASAVLGHLNTVLRLVAGVVEKTGVYTRSGSPRVSGRVGVIEAIG